MCAGICKRYKKKDVIEKCGIPLSLLSAIVKNLVLSLKQYKDDDLNRKKLKCLYFYNISVIIIYDNIDDAVLKWIKVINKNVFCYIN